jgi:drug/metabolite transporter (DMT)-like permease
LSAADYGRLVVLSAIWGASFIFQRIVAPELGAVWTAETRVLVAGIALLTWFRFTGFDPQLRRHWKAYVAIGATSSAIPFTCFGFASIHAPAGVLALLNASAPLFGAISGALWLGERFTTKRVAGLAAGALGVALVSRPDLAYATPLFYWAVAAALLACVCYGVNGAVVRKLAADAPSKGIAVGSQLGAALLVAPFLPFSPVIAEPSAFVVANALVLAVLCGAVAYVLFFRLMADIGATRALTVTYFVPVFGLFWAWLFLGESISPFALAGGALILAGVVLVTRG